MQSHKEVSVAEYLIKCPLKLHDRSGTHLFGKYIAAGSGKEASIESDDSYHKPETVTLKYVNCSSYDGDYFGCASSYSLPPGYLETGLPV